MSRRLRPSLNWLLVFLPIAALSSFFAPGRDVLTFVAAGLAIVPLAGSMGRATGQLAMRTGEGIGGMLNATFGNAAELIIGLLALRESLFHIVRETRRRDPQATPSRGPGRTACFFWPSAPD